MLVRALGVQVEGQAGFADITTDAWYSSYVATAIKLGIVNGRSKDRFAPNATISREEMAVMLVRALEAKQGKKMESTASQLTFSDASSIHTWAIDYVNSAAELGLVQGRANNQFVPEGLMTRAESAQVIYKLLAQ